MSEGTATNLWLTNFERRFIGTVATVNALRTEAMGMSMPPHMRAKIARKIELLEAGLKAMTEPEPQKSRGGVRT